MFKQSITAAVLVFFARPVAAIDLPQVLSFEGNLTTDSSGAPIASPASLSFQILDPNGGCVLYEETQSSVALDSAGNFSVKIGPDSGGSRVVAHDGGLAWRNIFQNDAVVRSPAGSYCTSGYTPAAKDGRKLRVFVNGTALSPDFSIAAVPMATVAESLQGKVPADFVSVVGPSAIDGHLRLLNQGEMRFSPGAVLSKYVGFRAPASVANNLIWTLPAADGATNQVLSTDGSGNLSWANPGGGGLPGGGSSSAPAYSFNADTNTGLFSPVSDNVSIATNGAERLRIDSNGFVGIGTTAPTASMEVASSITGAAGTQYGVKLSPTVNTTASAGYTALHMNVVESAIGSGTNNLVDFQVGGTSKFSVSNAGAVTASAVAIPGTGAYNAGGASFTQTSVVIPKVDAIAYASSGATTAPSNATTSPDIFLYNSSSTDGGSVFYNMKVKNAAGVAQQAYVAAVSTTGGAVYTPSIVFGQQTGSTAYSEVMRIDPNGRIGIGTVAPVVSLDIGGRTDAIRVPAGTTGQQPGSPVNGMIRYNSTNNKFEAYENGAWVNMISGGGGTVAVAGGGTGLTTLPSNQLILGNGTSAVSSVSSGTAGQLLMSAGAGAAPVWSLSTFPGSSSVNSMMYATGANQWGQLSAPSSTSVLMSAAGTNQPTWTTGATGDVLRGGASGASFGPLVATDIPSLDTAKITSGYLPVSRIAGAGASASNFLRGDGTWASELPAAAGTAAAPGYAFSGNTNTGMFGAASNQIGFAVGGAEKLRLDSSGNVGIGTTAPGAKLHVVGAANITGAATIGGALTATGNITSSGTISSTGVMMPASGSGSSPGINFGGYNTGVFSDATGTFIGMSIAGTEYMRVASGGKIGIGTQTPGALLEMAGPVTGAAGLPGKFLYLNQAGWTDSSTAASGTAPSNAAISIASPTLLASNSNVTTTNAYNMYIYGGPIKGANNTATNAIALGIGPGNVGAVTNSYGLWVSAGTGATNNYGAVFQTGNVGIGITNPSYTLHVSGTAGLSSGTAWTNASDIRLKDLHGDYEYGLEEVMKLHTVRFTYKKDNPLGLPSDHPMTGFIAQEVRKVIPDAVQENKNGYLELNVDPIHWAVVNAIKELKQIIDGVDERQAASDEALSNQARDIASIKSENSEKEHRIFMLEEDNRNLKAENAAIKAYLCGKDPSAPICK